MATESELRSAYAAMRAAFPSWAARQDKQSVRIWGDMLGDAPGDALVSAIKSLARSSRFAPTVAEIREAAGCEDPGVAERRAASRAAAERHAAWVERQQRIATERARESQRQAGKDPDAIEPMAISELTKGIGR